MIRMHPSSARILTATLLGDKVLLGYTIGAADGIKLLTRRGTEIEFSAIAEDEPSPFIDGRPKLDLNHPETRIYRAILSYGSGKSQLSAEIKLTMP